MRSALAVFAVLGFAGIAHATTEYRCSPCDQGGLQVCGDWDGDNHYWVDEQTVQCGGGGGGGGGPVSEYRCSPCDQGGLQVCGQWDPVDHYWVSESTVQCQ